MAVSMAERPDPAMPRRTTGRAGLPRRRSPDAGGASGRRSTTDHSEPRTSRETHRSRPGKVPASLTAVEGSFETVAVASPSRRAGSGLILVTIVVGVAVAIAAGIGLVAVTLGHMLDSAIG